MRPEAQGCSLAQADAPVAVGHLQAHSAMFSPARAVPRHLLRVFWQYPLGYTPNRCGTWQKLTVSLRGVPAARGYINHHIVGTY